MSINLILILICCVSLNTKQINCAPKLGSLLFEPLLYEANLTNYDTTYQYEETHKHKDSKPEIYKQIFNISNKSSTNNSYLRDKISQLRTNLQLSNNSRKISTDEVANVNKPCLGYDFDETLCRNVGNRVICGYNKNIGNITNKIIDYGNGCRIRDDRLECGYLLGPFINPRRPPARDDDSDESYKHHNKIKKTYHIETTSTKTSETSANYTNTKEYSTKTATTKGTSTSLSSTTLDVPSFITTSLNFLMATIISMESSKRPSSITSSIQSTTNIPITGRTSTKQIFKRHCVEKNDHIFCYRIKN